MAVRGKSIHSMLLHAIVLTLVVWAGGVPARAMDCPRPVGRWGHGTVYAVAADEAHVYVGCGTGLQIYGIEDPAHPRMVSELLLEGQIHCITLKQRNDKTYAFIAGSRAGMIIVDVSDRSAPVRVGGLDTPHYAWDVTVEGNLAYVADHDFASSAGDFSALHIMDIRDIAHPSEVGNIVLGAVMGVAVQGGYAYLATFDGLRVVDVRNPASPCEVGSFLWEGMAQNVEIRPGPEGKVLAYVCDPISGLLIIDVSDPGRPTLFGIFDWWSAYDITFVGSLAYIAALFDSFVIVDISDPSEPQWIGYLDTQERVGGVAVPLGEFAYLANIRGSW